MSAVKYFIANDGSGKSAADSTKQTKVIDVEKALT